MFPDGTKFCGLLAVVFLRTHPGELNNSHIFLVAQWYPLPSFFLVLGSLGYPDRMVLG